MNNGKIYSLEEYKILKDEAKSFTNQSFRDFQLFIGLIAIFFALINSRDSSIPKFASYSFMEITVFIFLVIQFNRLAYLLVVRNHLAELENRMNKSFDKGSFFEWESKIIPSKIAPRKSYSSISQLIIGAAYLLIFGALWLKSYLYSMTLTPDEIHIPVMFFNGFLVLYYLFLGIEIAIIVYSLIYFAKHTEASSQTPI
jgi:hypothetical protein